MAPQSMDRQATKHPINKNKWGYKLPRNVFLAFKDLVQENAEKRAKAAIIILKFGEKCWLNIPENQVPDDVAFIVRRLVGGLGSNKPYSRESSFATLQALLQLYPSAVPFTYQVIQQKLVTNEGFKKDLREMVVGELLAYGAIVRSGQAHKTDMANNIIEQLCAIRKCKSYLDVMASQFLVNMMENCKDGSVAKLVLDSQEQFLKSSLDILTPSLLWLRLVLMRTLKQDPPAWLASTLIPLNYSALTAALMKTLGDLPKVHPVLNEVVASLAASSTKEDNKLLTYWEEQMAPYLQKLYTGQLQLLLIMGQLILPRLTTSQELKRVLTGDLVVMLMASVSRFDKNLSTAARGLGSALLQIVVSNQSQPNDIQLTVVKAMVLPPGSLRFDHLTGTKLLTQMIVHFNTNTVKEFTHLLNSLMQQKEKKEKRMRNSEERVVAQTLKMLLAHPEVRSEEHKEWRRQQLALVMKMAMFTPGSHMVLRDYMDTFIRVLSTYTSHMKEYSSVMLYIVSQADKELDANVTEKASPLTEEVKGWWKDVVEKLEILQEEEEKAKGSLVHQVLQILYCQMGLHFFTEPQIAKDIIDELDACHREVMKKRNKKKKSKARDEEGDEEELHWVEVVTELLLSLMTQERNIFRSVAQGIFKLMCPLVTPSALTLVTDVLDPEKAQALVGKDQEMEKEEEEEEEEDDEEEDNEEEDEKEEEQSDESSDEEDDEEEEEGDDNEEEDTAEDKEDVTLISLKRKIMSVTGAIDMDVDMDSVPEEELNRLDERLSAVFAEHKQKLHKKKTGKSYLLMDERSLMNFQSRCCDLLEVYFKSSPTQNTTLGLVIPIVHAFKMADKDSRLQPLQARLSNIMNALGKVKFQGESNMRLPEVMEILDAFFDMSLELPGRLSPILRNIYSLIFRSALQALGDEAEKPDNPLVSVYAKQLSTFFSKPYPVRVHVFMDPCSYNLSGLWGIMDTVFHFAFDLSVKSFRRDQAIQVLEKLYQNKVFLSERTTEQATRIQEQMSACLEKALLAHIGIKTHNLHLLMTLFSFLLVLHKIDTASDVESMVDWKKIGEAVVGVRQNISRKDLKKCRSEYNRLREALKLPRTVCMVSKEEKKEEDQAKKSEMKEEYEVEKSKIEKKEDEEEMSEAKMEVNAADGEEFAKENPKKRKKKRVMFADEEKNHDGEGDEYTFATPKAVSKKATKKRKLQ